MEAFNFTSPIYAGETSAIERDGFTITATIYHDPDHGAPWEEEDGHGAVTDWTNRQKAPGERILAEAGGRGYGNTHRRFYDWAGAVKTAKADGWDAPPYGEGTAGQRAVRAVEADFQHLRAWCNDDWFYVGVAVTVSRAGVELTGKYDHAIWGTENTAADHINELAADLVGDALDAARAKLRELTHAA